MSRAKADSEEATAPRQARRRFAWWKALALCLAIVSLLAIAAFVERKPIAAFLVQAYLLKYGIASSVEFDQLSRGGFVAHVRVGPETPEFSAEVLDVTLNYNGLIVLPQIGTVRLVRPVLRASYDGERISFGSLQPLVDEALAKQPEGPGPSVTVEGGTLYVATPAGLLQFAVDAAVDKGKLNRLNAELAPAQLRSTRFNAEITQARLIATVTDDKLDGAASFRGGTFSSSGTPEITLRNFQGNADLHGVEWRKVENVLDIVATSASAAIKSDSAENSQNIVAQPEIKFVADNPRAHVDGNGVDIVAERASTDMRSSQLQSFDVSSARSGAHLSIENLQSHFARSRSEVAATQANLALEIDGLKSPQGSAAHSKVQLDFNSLKAAYERDTFRGSAQAETVSGFRDIRFGTSSVGDLSLSAAGNGLTWELSGSAWSVAGPLHGTLDAKALRYGIKRSAIILTSLRGAFAGSQQIAQTGFAGNIRGSLTADVTMPRALADSFARDVPVAGADSKLAAAFASALVDAKLQIPDVDVVRSTDSTVIRFAKPISLLARNGAEAELSSQMNHPVLRLIGDAFDGEFQVNAHGGGLPELALQVPSYRLRGEGRAMTMDASAAVKTSFDYGAFKNLQISANTNLLQKNGVLTAALERCADLDLGSYDANGTTQLTAAKSQICSDPGAPFLQVDNAGWRIRATWSNAHAKVEQAQSILDAANGRIALNGDGNGPKTGRLEVMQASLADAQTAVRYRPVNVAGSMNLANQEWAGTFDVVSHQRKLAAIQVKHAMDSGVGSAAIQASDIAFDPMFQPTDISPLLASLGTRVRGHASFSGQARWNAKTMESDGLLHVLDVDVQTPLGMARGVRGDLALTSLVPVTFAPSQTIAVNRVDWPVPAERISARFSLTPNGLELEQTSADVAGGRASLDPLVYSFAPAATTRGTVRFEHVDLTPLIAAAGLADKVKVTARMGGIVPFTMGPEGLRFANGHIAAESPGHLSIERTALTSAVGTGASGQAQPNAVQDFAYQALENLSFSELNGDVNSRPMGRLGVLLHVKGEHDPARPMETRVGVVELLQGRAFDKPLPLPKGTPIDLTLDTSVNLDELLASYFGNAPRTEAAAK